MSRHRPGFREGNKIVDAVQEPQPERPIWMKDGSLVCSQVDLEGDTGKRKGWLTYARGNTLVKRGDPGIYMGEERVSVTDKKGVTTRKVVHAFFFPGGKFLAEPRWFREYTGDKEKDKLLTAGW